jgi:hypothetical protein
MKKLISVSALALALVAGPAFAEEDTKPQIPTDWFKVPVMVDCAPMQKIVEMVSNQFGEIPMMQGEQIIQWANGQAIPAGMALAVNSTTKSWTLVSHFPDGIGCVIASGGKLTPVYTGKKISIKHTK